ncbi:MAG: hypothetical protein K1X35_09430 [Caulobacteraceae bacterium]|nr:hypothetical protein [Caulobacteraceae bacterium]
MSPRRGVFFTRFGRPVLAAAWAALSLGGATITPYQSTRTPDFPVRADPLGEKTVWFHTDSFPLHQLIRSINADLKECRLADYRRCALDQPHPIIVIDLSNAPMSRDN